MSKSVCNFSFLEIILYFIYFRELELTFFKIISELLVYYLNCEIIYDSSSQYLYYFMWTLSSDFINSSL